jgi:hypothetical protein
MSASVNISNRLEVVFERFWKDYLQENLGSASPPVEEELALIHDLLDQGVRTVPLEDGRVVEILSDGSADVVASDQSIDDALSEDRSGGLSDVPKWQIVAFVLGALVLFWPLIGDPVKGFVGGIFGSGGGNGNGGEDVSIEAQLPEGIDALVKSGDVKAPLVTPRTLEIRPSGVSTSTTFVVVPVEVEEADWPCPTRKFKGEPAACWVFGTVVNYLVGIPSGTDAEALFDALQSGGEARLRLSTEKVLRFVVDGVQEIERHQTEVLGQHHFGLTLVGLGGEGPMRRVARASYIPEEIAGTWEGGSLSGSSGDQSATAAIQGGGSVSGAAATAETHTVTLGERVDLSEMVSIVILGLQSGDDGSSLVVGIENRGSLPYTPNWRAAAETDTGEVVTADITQKEDRVILQASARATAWTIQTSGHVIRVTTGGN